MTSRADLAQRAGIDPWALCADIQAVDAGHADAVAAAWVRAGRAAAEHAGRPSGVADPAPVLAAVADVLTGAVVGARVAVAALDADLADTDDAALMVDLTRAYGTTVRAHHDVFTRSATGALTRLALAGVAVDDPLVIAGLYPLAVRPA